jgi:hypothetical protein
MYRRDRMETRVKVVINARLISSYHTGEQFGDWEESFSNTFEGVYLATTDSRGGEHFTLPYETNEGDEVHVVWMEYGTGDSFGNSDGEHEIVWVFKNLEMAKTCVEIIRKSCDDGEYSYTFPNEQGNAIKLHNPASGYFETLQGIHINTTKLQGEKDG